ncbi:GIY-YIG nuclease family protein [Algiphilus sp.]|uniref:GIY-YIG nuclease family protein n=1 Tax=Algiphilus sp. TaxID=1872431 RepID=UPI003BAA491B
MTEGKARPTSIRIFLADGVPDGLRVVEKSNWTGRAVVASRSQLVGAIAREELAQPGVYVLTGATDDGAPKIYVGEADVLRDRLKQHVAGKDFWTRFVAFTSTNEGLNKAHVRYLESRLIGLAQAANQWSLDNGTVPSPPPLSEADRADAEWFLEEMLVIFPLLGVDAFESAAAQATSSGGAGEDVTTLYLNERGAKGSGREVGDGFVVNKGSQARKRELASMHQYMRDLREQLLERDVLREDGDHYVFAQDFRFGSPSTAAGVLVGGAANGRTSWKDGAGRTLKALQEARAETLVGEFDK